MNVLRTGVTGIRPVANKELKIFMMELLSALSIVSNYLTVTVELVLVGSKSFKSYRSSCVDLASADTNFGTET